MGWGGGIVMFKNYQRFLYSCRSCGLGYNDGGNGVGWGGGHLDIFVMILILIHMKRKKHVPQ